MLPTDIFWTFLEADIRQLCLILEYFKNKLYVSSEFHYVDKY